MPINADVFAESVFVFAGALGIVRMIGTGVAAATVMLALWVVVIEGTQPYSAGRVAGITEPQLVAIVACLCNASTSRR